MVSVEYGQMKHTRHKVSATRPSDLATARPAYVDPKGWEALTGISKSTWAKRRRTGDTPPFVKLGKSIRYPVQTGLEWLARRARGPSSHPLET
jgi:predicted DNA-binding transcriptional regulator AlpA